MGALSVAVTVKRLMVVMVAEVRAVLLRVAVTPVAVSVAILVMIMGAELLVMVVVAAAILAPVLVLVAVLLAGARQEDVLYEKDPVHEGVL